VVHGYSLGFPDNEILDNLVLLVGWCVRFLRLLCQPCGVLSFRLCDFFSGEFDLRYLTRLDVYDCAVHGLPFVNNVNCSSVKGVCAVDCGDADAV
jgi:hypothetical protein